MTDDSGVSLGSAEAIRDTGKALLCKVTDIGGEIWVPLSVIHDDSEVFDAALKWQNTHPGAGTELYDAVEAYRKACE